MFIICIIADVGGFVNMSRKNNADNEDRRGLHYSDQEDKTILLMIADGATAEEISHKLGHNRSVGGVIHRIDFLLNKRKKKASNISLEEAKEIIWLHMAGKSSTEICNATNRSDRTVKRISDIADLTLMCKEEMSR